VYRPAYAKNVLKASAFSSTAARDKSPTESAFRPLWLIIADILPSGVYVRKPVGFGPNGASFRSLPAVESEADTNFHVPTILILDSPHVSAIQDSHQSSTTPRRIGSSKPNRVEAECQD
jgi:hypothetical protein